MPFIFGDILLMMFKETVLNNIYYLSSIALF